MNCKAYINRFYEIYNKIAKKYSLTHQATFETRKNTIKIYQVKGETKKQVVKVETDEITECWEKAAQALTAWVQGKETVRC